MVCSNVTGIGGALAARAAEDFGTPRGMTRQLSRQQGERQAPAAVRRRKYGVARARGLAPSHVRRGHLCVCVLSLAQGTGLSVLGLEYLPMNVNSTLKYPADRYPEQTEQKKSLESLDPMGVGNQS